MNIDDRWDRLRQSHEALAASIRLLSLEIRELRASVMRDSEKIQALLRVAEHRERRIFH